MGTYFVSSSWQKLLDSVWHRRPRRWYLEEDQETSPSPVFSSFKELAFGLGIYTYFLGWIYAYYYFLSFQITLASLDIPVYYFAIYSFSALYCKNGISVLSAVLLTLPFVQRRRYALYALFVLLIPVFYHLGRTRGLEDADSIRSRGDNDRVELSLDPKVQESLSSDLIENNKNGKLRFLEETKDRLILFYQPPDEDGVRYPVLVYDLKRDKIVAIKKVAD